jgi:hypothetical protein
MIIVKCQYCGKEFKTENCRIKVNKGKFCSRKCACDSKKGIKRPDLSGKNNPMFGKHLSEETKRKLSEMFKGRFVSEETRKKMSIGLKGRTPWNKGKTGLQVGWNKGGTSWHKGLKLPQFSGENSATWKGGITPEHVQIRNSIEYTLWRNSVFSRDNFTCQKTGVRGGNLIAHHIYNFADYPELRFAIDNGITLSLESHKQFHKIYGKSNTTKEQLEEFLNNEQNG